jgi:hypothetical protein
MGGISRDFIVGLPLTTRRHNSIFVVFDTLMKSAHFILVRTMYQAPNIDRVFISEIVRLHGVPKRIISDRGSVYHLSPEDRRADRMNEPNLGGYVAYVRDGPTEALGRIFSTGRICV